MPIIGLRFKEGLVIPSDTDQKKFVESKRNQAQEYMYGPGEYDVTPSDFIYPATIHILRVFLNDAGTDTTGIYWAKPRFDNTTMNLQTGADQFDQLRTVQKPLGPATPAWVVISHPEYLNRSSNVIGNLIRLIIRYQHQSAESAVPAPESEPRRDLEADVVTILSTSKNKSLSEAKLIQGLIHLDPSYAQKDPRSIAKALSVATKYGAFHKNTKASPPTYRLP